VGKPPKRQQISGIHEPKPEFFEPVTKKAAHLRLRKKKNRFVQRFPRVPPKALAVMDLIARGFLPPANEFSRITSEPLFTLGGVAALLDMKEEALTYLLLSRPPRFMVQRSKQSEYHPPAM
jgi:hypothetical protein